MSDACHRCHLSARHPMAHLNGDGVCAPCRRAGSEGDAEERRDELLARMESLFEQIRSRGGTRVLLAYSGGKDSTWTLLQLRRRFGLKVRALTLDNGFLSDTTHENASKLASTLGADHVVVRPPRETLRLLFSEALRSRLFSPTALTRASSVCNACIAVVKAVCLREALRDRMDVVVWGWNPGQAPLSAALLQPSRAFIRQMIEQLREPLECAVGERCRDLLFDLDRDFGDRAMPHFVSPLALIPHSESKMVEELEALGWVRPRDVDPHSTNCRLNALASHEHQLRHSFHPYALETAGLVRAGLLDPELARERLAEKCEPATLIAIADELELDEQTRRDLKLIPGEPPDA